MLAFYTAPLNWWQWLASVAFGLTSLIVGGILRLIPTNDHIERVRRIPFYGPNVSPPQSAYNVELSPDKLAIRLKRSTKATLRRPSPSSGDPQKTRVDLEAS